MTRDENVKIYKYPLEIADRVAIEMPAAADVLCVQLQDGKPFLWAKVDLLASPQTRVFYVVGTGHPMVVEAREYVGTFQTTRAGQSFVWHVFEG